MYIEKSFPLNQSLKDKHYMISLIGGIYQKNPKNLVVARDAGWRADEIGEGVQKVQTQLEDE